MASTTTTTEEYSSQSKIAPEAQVSRNNQHATTTIPTSTLILRVLLFASSLIGIIVMVTSKQTELIPVSISPVLVTIKRSAKFNTTPAFVYLVAALAVACFYSIISIIGSLVLKNSRSQKLLFHFILIDLVMLGIVASATGAAGSIGYTGLKGNSHANWGEVCNVFDKFCRHVGSSVAMSLVASIALLALAMLSTRALYLRSS